MKNKELFRFILSTPFLCVYPAYSGLLYGSPLLNKQFWFVVFLLRQKSHILQPMVVPCLCTTKVLLSSPGCLCLELWFLRAMAELSKSTAWAATLGTRMPYLSEVEFDRISLSKTSAERLFCSLRLLNAHYFGFVSYCSLFWLSCVYQARQFV